MKRLLAILLAAALCVSLVACGKDDKKETPVTTLAQELGYGYLSEYSNLNVDLSYINSVSTAQGKLYVTGEYYDEVSYASETRMYAIDLATGETEKIPMPETNNDNGMNEHVQNVVVCSDGSGYWYLTETYVYSEDGGQEAVPLPAEVEELPAEELPTDDTIPEVTIDGFEGDFSKEDIADMMPEDGSFTGEAPIVNDDTEEGLTEDYPVEEVPVEDFVAEALPEMEVVPIYQEPNYFYTARKCDFSGNVIGEIDLSEVTSEVPWFYCQQMVETAEGDLLIYGGEKLFCFGADGQRKANINTPDTYYISSLVVTETGTVLVSGWAEDAYEVCRIENGTLSAPMTITGVEETANLTLFPGSGDTVLGSDGEILYSIDVKTGAATKLLSWLDSDINGTFITGIVANGAEKVLVLMENWMVNSNGSLRYELGTLTKTPVENMPVRTLLTIGGEYLDMQVKNAIIDFNRKNDVYRITFKDYSVYNTTEDYTLAAKQMDLDVVSGAGPDIISLSGGNVEKYISKGVLADMNTLMEADDTISMDMLLQGPLKAYQKDGKLYAMPYSFVASTLYGSRDLLGDRDSWTLEEMTEVIRNLPEDVKVFQYYNRQNFLSEFTYQKMGQFVDYGAGTCSFDSDAFKGLLEVAAKLPEEITDTVDEYGNYVYVDERQAVMNGEVLLASGYLSGSNEIEMMYNLYTEDNGFVRIGYPTESGSGLLINSTSGVAITANCRDKAGAWSFVKSLLTEDFQSQLWSLPVLESAFDAMMAEEMEPNYYEDINGEKVYVDNEAYLGETSIVIDHISQAQVEQFKEELNQCMAGGRYDSDIVTVVTEEAEAYFNGDKSVDEVAKLIQNRVSIYLGETS